VTTDRIRDALRRLSAVGLSVVACACLVVFAGHKSEHPSLLGWSGRYLIAAVLPILGYVLAQGVLVFYPPLAVHRERYVAVGCLLVGVLVSALGVLTWPSYVGPILAVSLGLFAVPLAAYRASRTSEWLLSHVTLIVLCLVLVLPDVVGSILKGGGWPTPGCRVGPTSFVTAGPTPSRSSPREAGSSRVSISTSTRMIWVGRRTT
jgi:hypothetical protein